jgi:hypothetical protein
MLNDSEIDSFEGARKDDLLSLLRLIDVDTDGFHRDGSGKTPVPAASFAMVSCVSPPTASLISTPLEAVIDEHELVLKLPPMRGGVARSQPHDCTRIAVTSAANAKMTETLELAMSHTNDENKASAISDRGLHPSVAGAGDAVGDNSHKRNESFRNRATLDM